MSKHTPGPWSVVGGHYPGIKEISGPSFAIKAVMWATDLTEDDYQKRYADLRLIAAAPDLLEALEEVVRVFDSSPPSICDTVWVTGNRPETLYDKACVAIAKARGEK